MLSMIFMHAVGLLRIQSVIVSLWITRYFAIITGCFIPLRTVLG